jgi:hypothetical protein
MKELKEHVDHLLQEKCNSYRIAFDLPGNSLVEVNRHDSPCYNSSGLEERLISHTCLNIF